MASSPIQVKAFQKDDLPTLLAIRKQASAEDAESLKRWLGQPGMQPERDCFIAYANGEPTAYAYLIVEQPIRRGVLLPEGASEAATGALVERAEDHARELGLTVLHMDVPESAEKRRQALEARGYVIVRTHLHLRRADASPAPAEVPDGMRLRMAERADAPAITSLQNAAFTGSWGYCPNTAEEIEYRIFDLPLPGPDPVLLLEHEEGLVAYCWDHREGDGPGIVGMVGVHPSQQGRGLGRVATATGINHWVNSGVLPVDITVDQDNTPAVRLYRSLGFQDTWRSVWYEKGLG